MHRQFAIACVLMLSSFGFARAQPSNDPPTLIIAGPGISTKYEDARHGTGADIFYHVQQMFGVGQKKFKPTTVIFNDNQACPEGRAPIGADRDNDAAIKGAAMRVGTIAAESEHSLLQLDMDLYGKNITVAKGLAGTFQALDALSPGKISLKAMGQEERGQKLSERLDAVRTVWNQETERTAKFIEHAAREFKKKHGQDSKVVVLGHSAFTNAINLTPLNDKSGDGSGSKPLIDFRVLSSPMVREFRETDRARTLVVTHEYDLPSANMGNIHSGKSSFGHKLVDEGTVLKIKGKAGGPLPLFNNKGKLQLPWSVEPGAAHTQTQLYMRTFEMEVQTASGVRTNRGTPAKIILQKLNAAVQGDTDFESSLIKEIDRKKPKESRVGGVTLTKPASVPIDSQDVSSLDYVDGRYVFQRHGSPPLELPGQIHPEITSVALRSIYGAKNPDGQSEDFRGLPPELSMMPFWDEEQEKQWTSISYSAGLPFTRLGDLMFETDNVLGNVAWGQLEGYTPPAGIPNYQSYSDLALDHEAFHDGKVGGRAWIVPATIDTEIEGDQLKIKACYFAIRFEFYPIEKEVEYYNENADVAVRDAAGEYLGAQLTANFDALKEEYTVLQDLEQATAFVGVLIWARQNGIELSAATRTQADADFRQNRENRAYGEPDRVLKEVDGNLFELIPQPELREVEESELARPALVFGQYGISRLLWEDQTESRIEYGEDGLVHSLHSRTGTTTEILYDEDSKPVAVVDADGHGIAILWQEDITAACYWARVDSSSLDCQLSEQALFSQISDAPAFIQDWVRIWMAVEGPNSAQQRTVAARAGNLQSWVRWSHSNRQIIIALVTALVLSGFMMSSFYTRPAGEESSYPKFSGYLLFGLLALPVACLLIALQPIPTLNAILRDNNHVALNFAVYVTPLVLAIYLLPRYHTGGSVAKSVFGALLTAGLLAMAWWAQERFTPWRSVLAVGAIVIGCAVLFQIYYGIFHVRYGRLPTIPVFVLMLAIAFSIVYGQQQSLLDGWSPAHAVVPASLTADPTSQTALVSVVQLAERREAVGFSRPESALMLPALVAATLGVVLDIGRQRNR